MEQGLWKPSNDCLIDKHVEPLHHSRGTHRPVVEVERLTLLVDSVALDCAHLVTPRIREKYYACPWPSRINTSGTVVLEHRVIYTGPGASSRTCILPGGRLGIASGRERREERFAALGVATSIHTTYIIGTNAWMYIGLRLSVDAMHPIPFPKKSEQYTHSAE